MEICYKYRIADAAPEDFLVAVDPSRLILEDKTVTLRGSEISSDVYDENGTVTNRITFGYNEAGHLVKQLDYVNDLTTPYKREERTYSESGKLLTIGTFYGDEPGPETIHRYDGLDRLVAMIYTDEEGEKESHQFSYAGTREECSMQEIYHGTTLVERMTFTHDTEGNTIEELHEEPLVKFGTYLFRYYRNNEVPNNVVWEKYNEQGDFLEECREVHDAKGNLLRRSWHTDDAADSVPYQAEVYEYDTAGVCVRVDVLWHLAVVHSERTLLDKEGRIARKLLTESNITTIICYRYETQE